MPDEKGVTRRERNELVEEYTPEFKIPLEGRYLWDWYFSISGSLTRVLNGICHPLPPSEVLAWVKMTETIVYPFEYDILREMDSVFCSEMNKELMDYQARQREQHQKELEASRKRKG